MWKNLIIPKMNPKLLTQLSYLRKLKEECEICFTRAELHNHYEYMNIKHIHSSLQAEGTKISEDDTRFIYENIMPSSDVEMREFKECLNLSNAVKCMNNISGSKPLTESTLLRLHEILGANILNTGLKNYAGVYRDKRVEIGRGNYLTAQVNQIYKLMKALFEKMELIENPIVKAAWFSYNLVSIHPFIDFNGRLSRLCESYILINAGYPVISLPDSLSIRTYMSLIRDGQEAGDPINYPYIDFTIHRVLNQLESIRNLDSANGNDNEVNKF